MPISANDLIFRLSLNMPVNDVSTTGGAIDPDGRGAFTQLAANDDLEVVSNDPDDLDINVTVYARDPGGAIVFDTVNTDGLTPVIFSGLGLLERVLSCEIDADAEGTITLQRSPAGDPVGTIPPGERRFRIFFYNSASDPADPKVRYEKGFWHNNHLTLSLTTAEVLLDADPSGKLNIRLEDAIDDNNSAANRLTEPAGNGGTWVGIDTAIGVPGGQIPAGSRIGTWFRQSLDIANAPIRETFDTTITGFST